ncbi:tannase/feruloyl esterase family alpha/beta hydrolase [Xanthomonas sp. A2111]|uniref:Tannase/feruloyl esterase family alpha/beta hydrolase n=1 Tax=Xanthomonas hawaiiensis TaxID=3003247 RepID=A0ABU2I4E6_9XANT|nr:tannase/feruloyl esterase family alpha/beta hydrolase [Xanthomonas sp. A2111]MBO9828262.1 tannase/feruloyl esterase family alpha/beta hydrolase [Xanthomonas sp. A2111]MDS9993010.1 tannase/feruloyl esterase family alpha/beta hydrolase [Xanthomonas sp. A2111]
MRSTLLALALPLAALAASSTAHAQTTARAPATPAPLQQSCDALANRLAYPGTRFTAVRSVAAGALQVAGQPIGAHCQITGLMHERVGTDGQSYAIGFEMRLPAAWNGRFFYQANGGLDGNVVPALGEIGGGGERDNPLRMGFAVISSDAGHSNAQNPLFGRDPQARLDYGYQAVQALTPMAKRVVQIAYGKAPDYSYFGGCSNGGRHGMVAAARDAQDYDGILVGDPGLHLPNAAIADLAAAQQLAALSEDGRDPQAGLNDAERALVADRILATCDALDGVRDGMVQDVVACQARFRLARDVPTCGRAGRTGQCLTAAQKRALEAIHAGVRNRAGTPLYAPFPYDPGIASGNWAEWRQNVSLSLVPASLAFILLTPPEDPAVLQDLKRYALQFDMDRDAPKIFATSGIYRESAWSFMTPPNETQLGALKARGGKLLVYHGTGDGIFSFADTAAWYDRLRAADAEAASYARLFAVPAMAHCAGGPATDQFDALTPLVAWVEQGQAPAAIVANARGSGSAAPNNEVPASWSSQRSRPLCPYPQVARYVGGDVEAASSFVCR